MPSENNPPLSQQPATSDSVARIDGNRRRATINFIKQLLAAQKGKHNVG